VNALTGNPTGIIVTQVLQEFLAGVGNQFCSWATVIPSVIALLVADSACLLMKWFGPWV